MPEVLKQSSGATGASINNPSGLSEHRWSLLSSGQIRSYFINTICTAQPRLLYFYHLLSQPLAQHLSFGVVSSDAYLRDAYPH